MKVTSTVKIYKPKIQQISQSAITALEKTGEAVHTDLVNSGTMPRDTGNLQNQSTFVDYSQSNRGTVSIISSTPYARRLYYHPEYQFSQLENPNAGGKWYEPYIKGSKKNFAPNAFKHFMKGGV